MADVTRTAADVRFVTHDPEDTLTLNAASGYVPAAGDLVAVSGDDEVNLCDGDAAGLENPFGIVQEWKKHRVGGADIYRVTVVFFGLMEGFTGLTPGNVLFNSDTPGAIDDAAGGTTPRTVAVAVTPTAAFIQLPNLG